MQNGRGVPGAVPALAGFTGYFLHLEEGREFLARVPGVAIRIRFGTCCRGRY